MSYIKKSFCYDKIKEIVRDHCHYTGKFRGVAHSKCNLRYKAPKEIPVVSHNGSTNDYYFIIKQLAEKFEGEFECLRENTEKYITFSAPIRKGNDNSNIITYKLTFIDSYRFISTSLSNLVDKLSGIYDKECKKCVEREKIRFNFTGFKSGRLNYKCKECKKSYTKLTTESIKNFPALYKVCNGDLNIFFLLLRKGIYPYEYIHSRKKFNENTTPPRGVFYSEVNLEGIWDAEVKHVKKV